MTCGYRNCQSRACGSTVRPDGHELAYCVAHEAIARHLPTLRSARCCTSEGCGRPQGSRSPLCKSCRPRYSAWGLDGYPVPQEAPMTEPTPLSKLPELGFPQIQVQTSGASLADLEAAVAKVTPPAAPQETADGGATFADILDALDVHTAPEPAQTGRTNLCGGTGEQMDPLAYDGWSDKPCPGCDGCRDAEPPPVDVLTEEEFVRAFEARMQQVGEQEESDGEPSEGDIQDAYSGRWGQYTVGVDPATGKEHTATYVVELVRPSDYQTTAAPLSAILGPRQDTPTLAEVQAELARERERADRAELDAVAERARAEAALESLEELRDMRSTTRAELHAVCLLMQRLGSYGPDAPAMLLRLLPVESRRALLEIEAADARGELARARANVVDPPPPEKLAEAAAKVAEVEARIAALDAGDVRG